MQVTETRSEGLKREYKVVLPAGDLASRVESQLNEIKAKANIKGFRPGKVPVAHLRRLYGRSIMAEVMQEAVNDANKKIVEDHSLRLAGAPKIDLPKDENELEKAFESKADLSYVVALEVLPKVEVGTFDDVKIERLVADIPDSEVDSAIQTLADRNKPFTAKEGAAVAETGDKVTVDFVGKVGGEAFQGGSAQDIDLVLGSGSFIPGFEDQIAGMKVGEDRTINVTFPDTYAEASLAGKPAEFAVTLKGVAAPGTLAIDDDFAKGLGFEGVEKLRESMRASLEREASLVSRRKWKRELLDALDKKYSFELPEELVSREFDSIWQQAEAEMKASKQTYADEGTTEEQERAAYRKIAERRVRLGLALAEIGESADVKVTDEEVAQALYARARQYPGMEKQFVEFYRSNPERLSEFRGPLFEEKVIDYVLDKSSVTDRHVSKDELVKDVDAAEKAAEEEAQKGLGIAPAAAN
jgi:trigger factor